MTPLRKKIGCLILAAIPILFLFLLYQTSTLRYLITPPSDLYDPLYVKEIDLTKPGTVYECEFINKYKGNHTIGIAVERPPDLEKSSKEWNSEIKIEVYAEYDQKPLLLSQLVRKPYYPYLWGHIGKGGFALVGYRSPDALPLHKRLKCRFTVNKLDKAFMNHEYGKTMLYVSKASDE